MTDNPFQTPKPVESKVDLSGFEYEHDGSGRAYVRQISVVASLLIAQGVLTMLFALFCAGYAVFMGSVESWIPPEQQAQFNAGLPEGQRTMLTAMFTILCVFSILISILNVVAGVRNLGFRSRGLGISTLLIGLTSMLTCYCAITGVPLTIYGLIIYFNPAVATAFRLRKNGMSKPEVLAQFVR